MKLAKAAAKAAAEFSDLTVEQVISYKAEGYVVTIERAGPTEATPERKYNSA